VHLGQPDDLASGWQQHHIDEPPLLDVMAHTQTDATDESEAFAAV